MRLWNVSYLQDDDEDDEANEEDPSAAQSDQMAMDDADSDDSAAKAPGANKDKGRKNLPQGGNSDFFSEL